MLRFGSAKDIEARKRADKQGDIDKAIGQLYLALCVQEGLNKLELQLYSHIEARFYDQAMAEY